MTGSLRLVGLATAGALVLGALPGSARADAVADFYKGKRLQMLIGYSSGGGYDTYARVIARHYGNHIPGKPSFIARNVPGAGSMRLMNEMYVIRAKDGTSIATVSRGIVQEELWGTKGVKFKSKEMNWIGSANNEVSVCAFWKNAPAATLNDLLTNELVVGGTGPGADTDTFPQVLNNVFGAKLKLVTGYPGGNDINLAMERGEVQGRCGWSWSSVIATRPQWLKNKDILIPIQMALTKHPDLPNVPLVMDLAKNDQQKKVLQLIFARQTMGRPFLTTPGVPADRVKALRVAFMATVNDAKFKAEADKAKLELNPVNGEEVQAIVADMFAAPPEVIAMSRDAALDASKTRISKAKVSIIKASGKIEALGDGGRKVTIAGKTFSISGSRTKITVAGKPGTRKSLKTGMTCDAQGTSEAKTIVCK